MRTRTILIVDDNAIILNLLEQKLHNKIDNINILKAKTYKDGVKHILNENSNIDIAILDLNLDDVDDDGALVKFALAKDIPTIVLTGIVDEKLKRILIEENILDYILKQDQKGLEHAVNKVDRILKNYNTNVLAVDDSALQLAQLKDILERMGLNVYTATNGIEAYDILTHGNIKFSLVLTDYNMPKMDGMDLTLKIRDTFDKDHLGVIVLSASDTPYIATQFIGIGANDFIYKPYTHIEVMTRINANLELLDLFEQTRDMANKDFMTGAYNRRYFFEAGNTIFTKAKRDNRNLAVVMFDIDKFKNINDTYGHDIGDITICEVANILNAHLRSSDLMARFGGEEFVVLLEDITLDDTHSLFEKIRKIFEENIITTDLEDINFTVSIGICYGLEDNLEGMIKKADDGLYYCKNNGRNQIAINKG